MKSAIDCWSVIFIVILIDLASATTSNYLYNRNYLEIRMLLFKFSHSIEQSIFPFLMIIFLLKQFSLLVF